MNGLKVTRKVNPGQHGSVRETKRYGSKLMATRYYRDDAGRFVKTAEVIVYERHEETT